VAWQSSYQTGEIATHVDLTLTAGAGPVLRLGADAPVLTLATGSPVTLEVV
jgi:hypothetical protein